MNDDIWFIIAQVSDFVSWLCFKKGCSYILLFRVHGYDLYQLEYNMTI